MAAADEPQPAPSGSALSSSTAEPVAVGAELAEQRAHDEVAWRRAAGCRRPRPRTCTSQRAGPLADAHRAATGAARRPGSRTPARGWPRSQAPPRRRPVPSRRSVRGGRPATMRTGSRCWMPHPRHVALRRTVAVWSRLPAELRTSEVSMGRTITVTVNGEEHVRDVEPRLAARALPARGARADRHAHRLRHLHLRRLHGARRRRGGALLHDARRAGRRCDRHDRRGAVARTATSIPSSGRSTSSTGSSAASARPG